MAFEYRVRSNQQWEERTNQRAADFQNYLKNEFRKFTPQKGENHIRILPPSKLWKNAPHYGLDCYAHFGIGPDRSSVICLDQGAPQLGRHGEQCPICQERHRMIRAGDDENARELRPVKRVLTFVINRRDEEQGALLWGMPFTLDRDISQISKDRDRATWYNIDDPKEGYDIYFKKEGEQLLTKYFALELAKRPSPVATRHLDWIEQHPLPECLRWRSYDEIQQIFDGRSRSDEDDDDDEPDDEPRSHHAANRGFTEEPQDEGRRHEDEDEGEDDNPPPQQEPTRRARPRSANGEEQTRAQRRDDPPLDGGRSAAPSSNGDERANQVRARFKKRRE